MLDLQPRSAIDQDITIACSRSLLAACNSSACVRQAPPLAQCTGWIAMREVSGVEARERQWRPIILRSRNVASRSRPVSHGGDNARIINRRGARQKYGRPYRGKLHRILET
jgi:hypothetical protein